MNSLALVLTVCLFGQVDADDGQPGLPFPKIVDRKFGSAAEEKPAAAKSRVKRLEETGAAATTEKKASAKGGTRSIYGKDPASPGATSPAKSRTKSAGPAHRQAAVEQGLAPVHAGQQKMRPPELLAEALSNIQEGQLKGKGLSLLAALSHSPDRTQQLKVAQSYWNLSAAQANYHFELDNQARLRRLSGGDKWPSLVQSARASSQAAVHDAELAVIDAQQKLAQQNALPTAEELPLAIDRPHVGQYRTYFESIFSGQQAPARLQLIDRMLPIWRRSIDVHGEALMAAVDAIDATADDFQHGDTDMDTFLRTLEELGRERRAFVAAVRDYNHAIAEYALGVARPGESESKLVSMLIKTSAAGQAAPDAPSKGPAGGARRSATALESRLVEDGIDEAPRTFRNTPSEPELEPANGPAEESGGSEQDGAGTIDPQSSLGRVSRKPAADASAVLSDGGIYQGLAQSKPAQRAQKLAGLLHWDRALPEDAGQGVSLVRCLERATAANRRTVIAAYWQARERVARFQVLSEQAEQLDMLSTVALELGTEKGSPTGMLRLRAVKNAIKAAVLDEQASLLAAQFEMAQLLGWNLRDAWPLPNTPPHAGGYRLATESLSKPLAESAAVQHLSRTIPLLESEIEQRSTAIVFSDVARAQTTYHGPHSLDVALSATQRQTQETLRFLRALTVYNVAIADYALAILPPDVGAAQLAGMLVTAREQKGDS